MLPGIGNLKNVDRASPITANKQINMN